MLVHTFGSMQSSLQSRLVEQKTIVLLFPPAPYTLTISLIVLVRLHQISQRDPDKKKHSKAQQQPVQERRDKKAVAELDG